MQEAGQFVRQAVLPPTSSASVGPAKNRPGWLLPKISSACGIVTPRQSFPRQALRNRCLWRSVLTCVIISVR
jgi:hypothetical protein